MSVKEVLTAAFTNRNPCCVNPGWKTTVRGYRFGYNPLDFSNNPPITTQKYSENRLDPLTSNPPVIHKGGLGEPQSPILLGKWLLRLDSNQQPSG
jgi:hypothetical protein